MKVNLFIVGAAKAGTTSLHYYLGQHPDISMSSVKEPNYFTQSEVKNLYYNTKPVANEHVYHRLFRDNAKIWGEASVSYLVYKTTAEKIFNYNSKAKIIVILRDPVERALSQYSMDARLGFCRTSLESIIEEPDRYPQYYQQFVLVGNYSDQIKKYMDVFGHENVMITLFDDLKINPHSFVSKVFDFLGMNEVEIDLGERNKSVKPRNKIIASLYRFKPARKMIKLLATDNITSAIKAWGFQHADKNEFLLESTREKLQEYYKNDILELEDILKRDLSNWVRR